MQRAVLFIGMGFLLLLTQGYEFWRQVQRHSALLHPQYGIEWVATLLFNVFFPLVGIGLIVAGVRGLRSSRY